MTHRFGTCAAMSLCIVASVAAAGLAREIHGAGDWYLAIRANLLQQQLLRCEQFADAGNEDVAHDCRNELFNADDFLTAHARRSVIPANAWLLCSQPITYELALAARCIVAIEDRCAVRDQQLEDLPRCAAMIDSGAYTANPAALRLDLSRPNPKAGR